MKDRRICLGLMALAIVLTGCVGAKTPIETLLDDPGRFDGRTVHIQGTVEEGVGVLGHGTYKVNDRTGTVWVVSRRGGAPRTGARTGVEGEFRSAFTVGELTAAVIMERRRFTP